jgi:Tol biopolymer transport system component
MKLLLFKLSITGYIVLLVLTLAMAWVGRLGDYAALTYLSVGRGIGIIDVERHHSAWLVADSTATSAGQWSPDGERLAYTAIGDDTGQLDLFVMEIEGTIMRRLTDSPYDEITPVWSPDSRMLAYVTQEIEGNDYLGRRLVIRVVDMESGEIINRLTQPTGLNMIQGWSPDNQLFVYITQESGAASYSAQIRFVDVATGELLPNLTQSEGRYSGVSWSPDSRWFSYMKQEVESSVIYLGNRGTGEVHPLPGLAVSAPAWSPVWSPDGQQLAYTALDYSTGGSRSALYLLDANRGETRTLTDHSGSDLFKAWSPDGQQIVVDSDRDGRRKMYSINPDTGAAQLLSPSPYFPDAVSWSPDGRWLSFNSGQTRDIEVYVIDMATYAITRLTGTSGNLAPRWRPG